MFYQLNIVNTNSCSSCLTNTKGNKTLELFEFRCDGKQGFVKIASLQPIRCSLTLTAEVHLGSSSFPGVGQPSAALCSWLSGTTELRGSDGGGSLWQRVGAERSTAAQISSVCFSGRFNLSSEVDLRKYAVRVGDSSRLRGWRGVSRGTENVLWIEESTLEKQVSFGAEDSYFPRCGGFGIWVIIGVHIFQVLSRVRACARLLRCCWPFLELVPVKWLLVPRCYPVGIIMQRLGVVLSTSTSNISMWNSTLVTPRSGWCACSP